MTCLALYDLDKTVLRHATFTPFLIFAAKKRSPLRLLLLPLWIGAMASYKLGAIGRGALKNTGLRLFLGGRVGETELQDLGDAFAARVVPSWIGRGAAEAISGDRTEGCRLILVTAAMHFYAEPIMRRLGFDGIIATHHRPIRERGPCRIDGENCYGEQKPLRVEEFFAAERLHRADCTVKFYSDSKSDAPLLDWADSGVLVDASQKRQRLATKRGWRTAAFR